MNLMGEEADAAIGICIADRDQPERRDAVEQLLTRLQIVDTRRCRAAHFLADIARIVEGFAKARMGLEAAPVRQINRVGRDIVDGGIVIVGRDAGGCGPGRRIGDAVFRLRISERLAGGRLTPPKSLSKKEL